MDPNANLKSYLAVSAHGWGRGPTIKSALRRLRQQEGEVKRYLVYRMPDGARNVHVDPMGNITWEGETTGRPVVVVREGASCG